MGRGDAIQSVLDGALDAVVATDRGGAIVGFNRAAEALFGWARDEVLGRPVHEVIVPARDREVSFDGRSQRTLIELQDDTRRRQVLTTALLAESPTLRSAMATYHIESRNGLGARADLTNTVRRELEQFGQPFDALNRRQEGNEGCRRHETLVPGRAVAFVESPKQQGDKS